MDKNAARLVSSAILILAGVGGIAAGSITPPGAYTLLTGLRPIELLGLFLVAGGVLVYIPAFIESRRS